MAVHPVARELVLGLGRIGYKALSSAVKVGLGEIAQVGETVVKRVRAGEAAAERMARGEPYTPAQDVWFRGERPREDEDEEYFR